MKKIIILILLIFSMTTTVRAGSINSIIRKQKRNLSASTARRDQAYRFFYLVVSEIRTLERKGMKFQEPVFDEQAMNQNDDYEIASRLNHKVILSEDNFNNYNIYFSVVDQVGDNGVSLNSEGDTLSLQEGIGDDAKVILSCSIYDKYCVESHSILIKNYIISTITRNQN